MDREEWTKHGVMLANRLKKRDRHLKKWARKQGTDAYRLYDRDIPEIPLVVDRYGGHLHVAVRDSSGLTPEPIRAWADAMRGFAAGALEIPLENTALKVREKKAGKKQYQRFAERGERFAVEEGGHRFWVNLHDYLDTGLFLDHRKARGIIGDESKGRRVLNLFAYTGSFGVYAAAAGAQRVVQVDLSRTYLDWAKDNLALNELEDAPVELEQLDTFSYLDKAAEAGDVFDIAIVDPPTFSNSKRMAGSFDVRRDYKELLRAVHKVMAPDGIIYFSTNARGFRLDAAGLFPATLEDITQLTRSEDFAERHSHRAWRILLHPARD
jgi:23S rRNA G2069 N7-methylase RlmK/C1962 C5-methylase RlmI